MKTLFTFFLTILSLPGTVCMNGIEFLGIHDEMVKMVLLGFMLDYLISNFSYYCMRNWV